MILSSYRLLYKDLTIERYRKYFVNIITFIVILLVASAYQPSASASVIPLPSSQNNNGHTHNCINTYSPTKLSRVLGQLFHRTRRSQYQKYGSSVNIDPCMLSHVTEEYSGSYPQGVSVSPDGHYILRKTLSKELRYGLDVMSISTHNVVASVMPDGDVLRPRWSPDGEKIAFFVLKNGESLRNLYIWNLREDKAQLVPDIHSYAESQVTWSPNSSMIGYSDPNVGLVVVDIRTSRHVILANEQPVSVFDWAPDSLSIVKFVPNQPRRMVRINLSGESTNYFDLREHESGLDIAWDKNTSAVLLGTSVDRKYRLSMLDVGNSKETTLYDSKERIRYPQWGPDGTGITFLQSSACCREIYYLKKGAQQPVQITFLQGWSDFGNNIPYENMVPYGHFSGDAPPELRAVSLSTLKDNVLYKDPVGDLDGSPSIRVSSATIEGKTLPGVLWKPTGNPLGLIVEIHNMTGAGKPVINSYEPEYRTKALVANQSGFAYLYVDCYSRDLLDNQDIASQYQFFNRLSSLVSGVQSSLHIKSHNTLLVAYSVGATVALDAGLETPERYGVLTLVGLGAVRSNGVDRKLTKRNHIHVILTESALDPEGTESGMTNIKNNLVHLGISPRNISTLVLDDVHLLMHPTSWISIQATMFDYLGGRTE